MWTATSVNHVDEELLWLGGEKNSNFISTTFQNIISFLCQCIEDFAIFLVTRTLHQTIDFY